MHMKSKHPKKTISMAQKEAHIESIKFIITTYCKLKKQKHYKQIK